MRNNTIIQRREGVTNKRKKLEGDNITSRLEKLEDRSDKLEILVNELDKWSASVESQTDKRS